MRIEQKEQYPPELDPYLGNEKKLDKILTDWSEEIAAKALQENLGIRMHNFNSVYVKDQYGRAHILSAFIDKFSIQSCILLTFLIDGSSRSFS